jgi:hypothetical protein
MVALDAFHEEWDDYMPEQFHLGQVRVADESLPEMDELIAFARDLFTRMFAAWPPDVPLISFTAMGFDPGQQLMMSGELLREQAEAKRAMYTALVEALSDGENRVLEEASHSWIHIERPDAVTQGIRDVFDKVRH